MTAPRPWNPFAWIALGALFLKELALSAWQVLRATLSPEVRARSAIVAVPIEVTSDAGITLLADMVTLTPGTTALHVSSDRRTLYVHAMDAGSPEEVATSIREGFERATRRVLA